MLPKSCVKSCFKPHARSLLVYVIATTAFCLFSIINFIFLSTATTLHSPVLHITRERNLFHAWNTAPESCEQWISSQTITRSYLDFFLIGVQKGATTELGIRLNDLGVVDKQMIKEWHFFQNLREPTWPYYPTALHMPYTPSNLQDLRRRHYLSGFPHLTPNITADAHVPLVDPSPRAHRALTYDATVEYMLSDRIAFLAHALTPHAKVVLSMRSPVDRALSEYNMLIRITNANSRKHGRPEREATPDEFDRFVRKEMRDLVRCGYHQPTGDLNITTSALLDCMYPAKYSYMENKLYVTRGLYHIHVQTWLRFFPMHRMQFISFSDVANGTEKTMQDLAKFLCVRPFPPALLQKYKSKASNMSYGVQAMTQGTENGKGCAYYGGKDNYLVNIFASTRKVMEDFFAPANQRLFTLMGRQMF